MPPLAKDDFSGWLACTGRGECAAPGSWREESWHGAHSAPSPLSAQARVAAKKLKNLWLEICVEWWWVQSNISGMCQVKVSALGPKSLMGAQLMLQEQVKPCSCSALVTQGRRVKAAPPAFGDCSSCFPASASLVLGCSPKMPKHTDPALTSGPNLFPSLCWSHGH